MSKPVLVRSTISGANPSSVDIDCTGGNYVVVKQARLGSSGIAWGSVEYDGSPLATIMTNEAFNTHIKISALPSPPQDEIQIDITQSDPSSHRVIVEVWSLVDLDAAFRDPRTSSGTGAQSVVFPSVSEHEVICAATFVGFSTDVTPSGNLINTEVFNTDQPYTAGYYSTAVGEDIEVGVSTPSSSCRFSGFILSGEAAPEGPVITDTTKLQAGKPLTITGTAFAASGNTVTLSPTNDIEDADAVTLDIDAEGTTEITTDPVTLPTGSNPGDTLYLFVEDDDDGVSDGFAILVADPVLRIDDVLKDTDTGNLIDDTGIEAIVLSGAAGSRTVALNIVDAVIIDGVCDIANAAFSIDELEDTHLVVLFDDADPAKGGGPYPATVIDRAE